MIYYNIKLREIRNMALYHAKEDGTINIDANEILNLIETIEAYKAKLNVCEEAIDSFMHCREDAFALGEKAEKINILK